MPQNRLILAILAFVLVAAACGGDDQLDEAADTSQASTTEAEQETTAPDAEGAAGQQPSEEPAPTPNTDRQQEADTALQPDPTVESEPVAVELGSRFIWCSQVQATWERHDAALAALTAARSAMETAADELSRAEAREALEDAEDKYGRQSAPVFYDDNLPYLLNQVRRRASDRGDDTQSIAFALAWEALAAADPDTANAIDAARQAIAIWRDIQGSESWQAALDATHAALAELVEGSTAYTAFKESFEESCQ